MSTLLDQVMDQLSYALVKWRDGDPLNPDLFCYFCGEPICEIESADSLAVLVRTVLDHMNEECKA